MAASTWVSVVSASTTRRSLAALSGTAGIEPIVGTEAKELQTALGLVASGGGVCIVPASVKRLGRDDVRFIDLDEPKMVSPIIMSHRKNDTSALLLHLVKLVREFDKWDAASGQAPSDAV